VCAERPGWGLQTGIVSGHRHSLLVRALINC
jgi:hypothetical protein